MWNPFTASQSKHSVQLPGIQHKYLPHSFCVSSGGTAQQAFSLVHHVSRQEEAVPDRTSSISRVLRVDVRTSALISRTTITLTCSEQGQNFTTLCNSSKYVLVTQIRQTPEEHMPDKLPYFHFQVPGLLHKPMLLFYKLLSSVHPSYQ